MKLLDDCFLHDKDRMRHHEAIELLKQRMQTIADTQTVDLARAGGRILAEDIIAPRNIPAFNNSAVDGYAFAHAEHEPTGGFFPRSIRIAAGDTESHELPAFSTARIFTGARMPKGADTIAMQEDCRPQMQQGKSYIAIPAGLRKGANCRLAGEDVAEGELVAKRGIKLRPQDLAAIASTGYDKLTVFKKLKVGLLSTGNEILRPGTPFSSGKVYDANHFMLLAKLEALNIEPIDLGICPDDEQLVKDFLIKETNRCDIILSTGGASRGEEDYLVKVLGELGKCHLWQLAVKPGRPMSFGQIGNTPVFTLPGNPVAVFTCFLLYVKPALEQLGGMVWKTPQSYDMEAGFSIKSKPERREFLRGMLVEENGKTVAKKYQRDGSGLISGLRESSGFIEIPEDTTAVNKGDIIRFIPFSEFGL